MARFYVGQRVRLVRAIMLHYLIGSEATILGWDTGFSRPIGTYEGWRLSLCNMNGDHVVAPPYCIEPLQPEGWQKVEWSDCLWQPETEAA